MLLSAYNSYKNLVKNRPDTEHQQIIIRIIIVGCCLIQSIYLHQTNQYSTLNLSIVIAEFLFSIGLLVHLFFDPGVNIKRRIVGLINDPLITTFFLVSAGEKAALVLFVYGWVAIGCGFRYSNKYMYLSASIGLVCMSYLFSTDEFWSKHPWFGIGILIMTAALTGFTANLFRRLRNAQAEIEKLALHDSLTGLANRRMLFDQLKKAVSRVGRNQDYIGLIYFDLDGFKKVNDEHGHATGDLLIKKAAVEVQKCLRDSDTFSRLGGDEFVVILEPIAKPEDSIVVAKRILEAIKNIKNIEGKSINVSASIGITKIVDLNLLNDIDPEALLKMADEAMYKAKKHGKDRIEITELA